jgi:hypothetical protein
VNVPTVVDFLSILHEKAQFKCETCIYSVSITDLVKELPLKCGCFLMFSASSCPTPNLVFGFLSRSASVKCATFFVKDDGMYGLSYKILL